MDLIRMNSPNNESLVSIQISAHLHEVNNIGNLRESIKSNVLEPSSLNSARPFNPQIAEVSAI